MQLIGPWVIGGGGADTERSLPFNYSRQLSRTSNHDCSDIPLNQFSQAQQPSNFRRNTIPPLAINCAINWFVGYWWRRSGYCTKSTFKFFPSNIKKILRSLRHRRAAAVRFIKIGTLRQALPHYRRCCQNRHPSRVAAAANTAAAAAAAAAAATATATLSATPPLPPPLVRSSDPQGFKVHGSPTQGTGSLHQFK